MQCFTGATGNIGGEVASQLLDLGVSTRVGVRTLSKVILFTQFYMLSYKNPSFSFIYVRVYLCVYGYVSCVSLSDSAKGESFYSSTRM